jgi:hypothetical protein
MLVRVRVRRAWQSALNYLAGPSQTDVGEADLSVWMLNKITDYWDANVDAVAHGANRLEALGDSELENALAEIDAAVSEHVRVLPDGVLLTATMIVADDLYKSACRIGYWNAWLEGYLRASAGALGRCLSERGFLLQYLVDNTWEELDRPVRLFPEWYGAAGLVYVCPQVIMQMLPEYEPIAERSGIRAATAATITEARDVAQNLVESCQGERRHFIHLDCDWVEGSFATADRLSGAAGVLTVLRDEAPDPGTTVSISYPEGFER